MLLLNSSKTITVGGVTVFPDHADPDQFWYLPAPVQLARRGDDNQANFTFIKYKPAVVQAGVEGGGFLMFESALKLAPEQEQAILGKLGAFAKGTPRLAAVPFDSGTVQCIALNLQGAGGTTASAGGPGTFVAVEKILGASVPSLQGDNNAAFSLTLSQGGAIILEQAFEQGTAPVGVIYDLKYTGMRPALSVKITADMKRVHDYFSASLIGQYYFVKAGVEVGLESLKQDGAITIEVLDFTGADDRNQKEQWALDFFKNTLISQWFDPTLAPFQFPDDKGGQAGGQNNQGGSSGAQGGNQHGGGQGGQSGGQSGASGSQSGGQGGTSGGQTGARQPAALTVTSSEPATPPPAYRIVHVPATNGTQETITVQGSSATPTVRVNNEVRPLNASRQLEIDVPDGASVAIQVDYPANPPPKRTTSACTSITLSLHFCIIVKLEVHGTTICSNSARRTL